jgi:hypothetical protein
MRRSLRFPLAVILVVLGGSIVSPSGAGDADPFVYRWGWATPTSAWEHQLLSVGDFDGDGGHDIAIPGCGGNSCWIVLTKGGEGYRQLAQSFDTGSFDRLYLLPVPGLGRADLVVHRYEEPALEIVRWTGSGISVRALPLATADPTDVALFDRDLDGQLELFVLDGSDLFVHDWETGALEITRYGFGGTDLDTGQVDADDAFEIAIATGLGSCWVVDGGTLAVDWGATSGFGPRVVLDDFASDPHDELLTDSPSTPGVADLRLFSPPAAAPLFEIGSVATDSFVFAAAVLDGLPGAEIVVGSRGTGSSLRVYSGQDGALLESRPAPEIYAFGIGDTDLAPGPEIATIGNLATGASLGGGLVVHDGVTLFPKSFYPDVWMQATGFDVGDLDGDGDLELAIGGWYDPNPSGPLPGAMLFAAPDGGEPHLRALAAVHWWNGGLWDFAFAELDGDGGLELCASYLIGYSYVGCYDGPQLEPIWNLNVPHSPERILPWDLDLDGSPELVVARDDYEGSFVSTYDAVTGWLDWQSPELGPAVSDGTELCVGAVESGGPSRILVTNLLGGGTAVLDPETGSALATHFASEVSSTACGDLDADGVLDVLAARTSGELARFDPLTGAWGPAIATVDFWSYVALGDLFGDANDEIVVISDETIAVLDSTDGSALWTVPGTVGFDGASGAIRILDLDGDDRNELLVQDGLSLVVFGRRGLGLVLFADGFESGDRSSWSRSPG